MAQRTWRGAHLQSWATARAGRWSAWASGSLRTYYQHTLGQDPLRHVGDQDITAHVDFTAVDDALASRGLQHLGLTTQADFLRRLGAGRFLEQLEASRLSRPELLANRAGMAELLKADGMGGFKVAVHGVGVLETGLCGLSDDACADVLQDAPMPLLDDSGRHIRLAGQSSGGYFEVESLEDLFRD